MSTASDDEPPRLVVERCDPRQPEFCSPPSTFACPQSPFPANVRVRFAGEVRTSMGYVTHWRYAKDEPTRPCTAAERAFWDAMPNKNACDVQVGEDLRLDAPFRIVEPFE